MPTEAFTDEELLAMCAVADGIALSIKLGSGFDEYHITFLAAMKRVGLWAPRGEGE
jgi:saccharopine dehydrogenase-like NADP-dependent oxidoreductase